MSLNKAVPAHVGADQRGIDVHDLSRGDLRLRRGLDGAFEDFAEPLLAPALANARQARMIRPFRVKRIASKPASRAGCPSDREAARPAPYTNPQGV
jgi:hypothetical protein